MKKVFLSVPMRNRTKENIEASLEKMKAHTRIALGEDVEFINTIVKETPPANANDSVWFLGKSIQLLADADVLVCVDCPYWLRAKGCENEKRIFQDYLIDYKKRELQYIELPLALVMEESEFDTLREEAERNEKACCCDAPCNSKII